METNTTEQAEANSVTKPSTEAGVKNDMIPKSRLDEVIGQRNDANTRIEKLEATINKFNAESEKQREDKLKANEQHEVIITELKQKLETVTEKADNWNTYQEDRRATLTEKLPENKREFTEGMDLTKLEKFVDSEVQAVNANANKTNSARQGVNPSGEFGGYSSMEEWSMKDPTGCDKFLTETVKGYQWGKVK